MNINISVLIDNISFTKNLERKLSSAKIAINSTWLIYIHNTKINLSIKMKIFNTACKSIMFYGAQIYGFERYEQVEKLFRFFIIYLFIYLFVHLTEWTLTDY